MHEIIDNLEKLLAKNYTRNPDLTERFLFVLDKLDKNEIYFKVSSELPRSILGGMSFNFAVNNTTTKPYFEVSDYFVNIYEKYFKAE